LTRVESGNLAPTTASYTRTDTVTASASSTQTGTNIGLSYTLTAKPSQLVTSETLTGDTAGNYTLLESASNGPSGQVFTDISKDSNGSSLTLGETDRYTLNRS